MEVFTPEGSARLPALNPMWGHVGLLGFKATGAGQYVAVNVYCEESALL